MPRHNNINLWKFGTGPSAPVHALYRMRILCDPADAHASDFPACMMSKLHVSVPVFMHGPVVCEACIGICAS